MGSEMCIRDRYRCGTGDGSTENSSWCRVKICTLYQERSEHCAKYDICAFLHYSVEQSHWNCHTHLMLLRSLKLGCGLGHTQSSGCQGLRVARVMVKRRERSGGQRWRYRLLYRQTSLGDTRTQASRALVSCRFRNNKHPHQ